MHLRCYFALVLVLCASLSRAQSEFDSTILVKNKVIYGQISPKSIVYAGKGKFFAQNMMYRHTVTAYNSKGELLTTIDDTCTLSNFGINKFGVYQGSPVEAAATSDGKYLWVSNYQMYGEGFDKPGCDACSDTVYDSSFVYAINTTDYTIHQAVEVGSVPKFMAISADDKYLAVSNWSSKSVTIIDQLAGEKIRDIEVGKYPRGLAFDSLGNLYVALMGNDKLAYVDFQSWEVSKFDIGDAPRHLIYKDGYLYISLNNENSLVKLDTRTNIRTIGRVGRQPRSMTISPDGAYLYVVNYRSNSLSKVRCSDMVEVQKVKTNTHPIGVTFDPDNNRIWVACYTGSIMLFEEKKTISQNYYYVVVASFADQSGANKYAKELIAIGYSNAEVIRSETGRYRVCVEKYNSMKEAKNKLPQFFDITPEAWVLK